VLHAASLFPQDAPLPPLLAFAMGTLGFLTPFEAACFEPLLKRCALKGCWTIMRSLCPDSKLHRILQMLDAAQHACASHETCAGNCVFRISFVASDWWPAEFLYAGGATCLMHLLTCAGACRVMYANDRAMFCTLRTRLQCEVYEQDRLVVTRHAFNEACLDRGMGTNFLRMECYIDGRYVTTMMVRLPLVVRACASLDSPGSGLVQALSSTGLCVLLHARSCCDDCGLSALAHAVMSRL
jgi:hypothetical protein